MNYKELEERLLQLGHTENMTLAMVSAVVSIDKYALSDAEKYALYSLLSETGFEALRGLPEAVIKGEWIDFDYGNMNFGDYVRVKKDAYTSPSGVNHNGKVGKIFAMSGGKCTIDYVGLDTGRAMPHPWQLLDSLKKV